MWNIWRLVNGGVADLSRINRIVRLIGQHIYIIVLHCGKRVSLSERPDLHINAPRKCVYFIGIIADAVSTNTHRCVNHRNLAFTALRRVYKYWNKNFEINVDMWHLAHSKVYLLSEPDKWSHAGQTAETWSAPTISIVYQSSGFVCVKKNAWRCDYIVVRKMLNHWMGETLFVWQTQLKSVTTQERLRKHLSALTHIFICMSSSCLVIRPWLRRCVSENCNRVTQIWRSDEKKMIL